MERWENLRLRRRSTSSSTMSAIFRMIDAPSGGGPTALNASVKHPQMAQISSVLRAGGDLRISAD